MYSLGKPRLVGPVLVYRQQRTLHLITLLPSVACEANMAKLVPRVRKSQPKAQMILADKIPRMSPIPSKKLRYGISKPHTPSTTKQPARTQAPDKGPVGRPSIPAHQWALRTRVPPFTHFRLKTPPKETPLFPLNRCLILRQLLRLQIPNPNPYKVQHFHIVITRGHKAQPGIPEP